MKEIESFKVIWDYDTDENGHVTQVNGFKHIYRPEEIREALETLKKSIEEHRRKCSAWNSQLFEPCVKCCYGGISGIIEEMEGAIM